MYSMYDFPPLTTSLCQDRLHCSTDPAVDGRSQEPAGLRTLHPRNNHTSETKVVQDFLHSQCEYHMDDAK